MKAKWILTAQAMLLGGLAVALFVKEIPGMKRELRILRMVGVLGSRHAR